jgi:hypothetical protein
MEPLTTWHVEKYNFGSVSGQKRLYERWIIKRHPYRLANACHRVGGTSSSTIAETVLVDATCLDLTKIMSQKILYDGTLRFLRP